MAISPSIECTPGRSLWCTATDACGNLTSAAPAFVVVNRNCTVRPDGLQPRWMTWSSLLDAPDGSGQVVVSGQSASFSGRGRSWGGLPAGSDGRIEGTLVQASGGGTWRFDLGGAYVPGSLQVLAGEVQTVTNDAVVFRLRGTPGEHVALSFRTATE